MCASHSHCSGALPVMLAEWAAHSSVRMQFEGIKLILSLRRCHSRKTFNPSELYQAAKGCIPLTPEKEVVVISDATADKLPWPPRDTIRHTFQADEESGL